MAELRGLGKAEIRPVSVRPLTAPEVASLIVTEAGKTNKARYHRVDRGLYLQIRKDGTCAWLFRFRLDGRQRWMGLGPARSVSVTEARREAALAQALVLKGKDPISERRRRRNKQATKTNTDTASEPPDPLV